MGYQEHECLAYWCIYGMLIVKKTFSRHSLVPYEFEMTEVGSPPTRIVPHHAITTMSQLIITPALAGPRDDPELTYVNVAIALAFILVDGPHPNTPPS